jgi:PAP2 superfamily
MRRQLWNSVCLLSGLGWALATAPPASAAAGESVVLQWNDATLQAIRDTHPGPPMCARDLAIVNTCMYDAWAAYDPMATGTRLGGTLRRPPAERTDANKSEAISFAAYGALVDLFPQPAEVEKFNDLMRRLGYDPGDASADAVTPRGIGSQAARAVLEFRHGDGANQMGDLHPGLYSDYTGYTPVNTPDLIRNPDCWQPLRISDGHGGFVIQQFVAPHWGHVIPFALTSGAQFRPALGPARAGTPEYLKQAEQILEYSAHLTDREKVIAEYWADGPSSELPPGHWCLFAHFVSQRDHHTLDQDVKLFFALGNAVFDASIVAWDAKRVFDSVRPVTAIHALFQGKKVRAWAGPYQATQEIDGGEWQPYQPPTVVTPPFPEFISGHSTFSAAGAEILMQFTGSDRFGGSVTVPAGSSRVESGAVPATDVTLSWATFSEAADEAGLSRRYGGIHFEDGDLTGRALGRLVGAQVWEKALAYFNGTAGP